MYNNLLYVGCKSSHVPPVRGLRAHTQTHANVVDKCLPCVSDLVELKNGNEWCFNWEAHYHFCLHICMVEMMHLTLTRQHIMTFCFLGCRNIARVRVGTSLCVCVCTCTVVKNNIRLSSCCLTHNRSFLRRRSGPPRGAAKGPAENWLCFLLCLG